MNLKEILSISGKSGLFKVVTQTKNGLIVESLLDQRRMPVYASDKISNLEEISIYTDDKEVPLKDVFKAIFEKESGGKTIDPKSDEKSLKEYFTAVLPNYDKEKVYASDIKKVMNWYNLLLEHNMMVFEEEVKEAEPEVTEAKTDEQPPAEEKK